MPILETILLEMAGHAAYDFAKAKAVEAYRAIFASRPDLVASADAAASAGDDPKLREVIRGALEIAAASGAIVIKGGLLEAVGHATFDHQHGKIQIGQTTVIAPTLVTGGGVGSTGTTLIGGNTELRSAGTSIQVGQGASIQMTGGASIKQT